MSKSTLHAFISYRRGGGSPYARIIADRLTARKMEVFLDVDRMPSGHFDETLYRKIEEAVNVIVILSPGCLDRCKDPEDWVRKEIAYAIKLGKNLIPLFIDGFKFPDKADLPLDIQPLITHHALTYNHELFDAVMERLILLMAKGKSAFPLTRIVIGCAIGVVAVSGVVIMFRFGVSGRTSEKTPGARTIVTTDKKALTTDSPPVALKVTPPPVVPPPPAAVQNTKSSTPPPPPRGTPRAPQPAVALSGVNEPEVVAILKNAHDFAAVMAELQRLKSQGKVMFGKKDSFSNPDNCHVVVIDKESKAVTALLGKGGSPRGDLLSGESVSSVEQMQGMVAIWVEIY